MITELQLPYDIVKWALIFVVILSVLRILLAIIRWWYSPVEVDEKDWSTVQDFLSDFSMEMKRNGWEMKSGDFSGNSYERVRNGKKEYASIEAQFVKRNRQLENKVFVTTKDEHGQTKTRTYTL